MNQGIKTGITRVEISLGAQKIKDLPSYGRIISEEIAAVIFAKLVDLKCIKKAPIFEMFE